MFCKNCGAQIDDRAVVCPHCGVAQSAPVQKEESNVLAIVGFVLSFFIAIAGLVCSILGMKKAAELGGKGHGLALAGTIISAISLVLTVIVVIIEVAVVGAALSTI